MPRAETQSLAPTTTGLVLHGLARYYDLIAWFMLRGREGNFRQRLLDLAHMRPGDSVLDIGCGTGTLALAAKGRVGVTGEVHGIDASREMLAKATQKARKAGADISFQNALAEELPFSDARFDVVLCTLMLHHLPKKVRQVCAREITRVLKPGGRALVVDFGVTERRQGFLHHFDHHHGHVTLSEVIGVLSDAGLKVRETGTVGFRDLHFTLGTTDSL